jgi:outer membrane protein assembly factor BamE (lipoprotein component of BamABCDE complex)
MRGGSGQSGGRRAAAAYALIVALALPLGGCFGETFQRGYVLPDGALEQIRLGASQEQVLIVLGTPSTVATVSGEAFYYISQRAERAASFLPTTVTDQRVVAIYFDKDRRVQRVAAYGLKDGKAFDFVSRTTPTAGSDLDLINAMLNMLQNAHVGLPF